MKVICDNCRAVYKIPDEKLVKPVNKATCRQCGHRMLIPRPRQDADPDEKTLVTAVPPTPPPAPSRHSAGPTTSPIEEESEQTLPGRREVPLAWATPLPASNRSDGAVSTPLAETPRPAARRSATPVPPAASWNNAGEAPTEVGEPTGTEWVRSEIPSKRTPPVTPRGEARDTPAPSSPASRPQAHDPSGDLTWALLGGVVGLIGLFLVAVTSLLQGPLGIDGPISMALATFGLFIGLAGGLTVTLVLLTGSRGRRRARPILSLGGASFLALIVAMAPVAVRVVIEFGGALATLPTEQGIEVAGTPAPQIPEITTDEEPAVAAVDADADADADDAVDATDAAAEEPVDAPEPAAEAPATQPTRPVSTSSSTSTRAAAPRRTAPTRSSRPVRVAAEPEPEPEPEDDFLADDFDDDEDLEDLPDDILAGTDRGSSSLPDRPPTTAIDIMLKNDVNVKKCFFYHQKDNGSLPKRIDVKFEIDPTGSASRVGVTQSKYAATDLDRCLGSAIREMTFPPSQKGLKLTFPFILG